MATEPQSPTGIVELAYVETRTGTTVRSATGIRAAQVASVCATARPTKHFSGVCLYPDGTSPRVYVFGYRRSSTSIKGLYLAAWVRAAAQGDGLVLDLTLRDTAGHSVASSSALIPAAFKSTVTHLTTAASAVVEDWFGSLGDGYLDLDAVAAVLTDPDWSIELSVTGTTGGHILVDLFEGWEVPRGLVDDGDALGSFAGTEMPGRPITSGPTTGAGDDGLERIAATIDGAVASNRTFLCLVWARDTAKAPSTSSGSYAALTGLDEGGGVPIALIVRTRPVYTASSSTGETAHVRVHYQVSGGGTGSVRVTINGTAFDLTSLTSASWAWSPWLPVTLPTDQTDHLITITIKAKTTAGTLYLAAVHGDENVS